MKNGYFSFKRLFWSYTFALIPFSLLSGLLSLFNVVPVNFNNIPQYGVKGLVISLLFIPFVGLIFSCLNWVFLNLGVVLQELFLKIKNKE